MKTKAEWMQQIGRLQSDERLTRGQRELVDLARQKLERLHFMPPAYAKTVTEFTKQMGLDGYQAD